jgi:hypothetical protein
MSAILTHMHGNPISSGILSQPRKGCRIRLYKSTMGVWLISIAGLTQGCDMVNIDSK